MKNMTDEEIKNDKSNIYFNVLGAGRIQISKNPFYSIGKPRITGFHFGVEWGRHSFAGGVLGKEEALKLADFIYKKLGKSKNKILDG